MRRILMTTLFGVAAFAMAAPVLPTPLAQGDSIRLFRDDLYLGLANHKVGCFASGGEMAAGREYDGFTDKDYCQVGRDKNDAKGAAYWMKLGDYSKSQADSCGNEAHAKYGTSWSSGVQQSSSCNYNVLSDCNSDCWMKKFTKCMGNEVGVRSPCW